MPAILPATNYPPPGAGQPVPEVREYLREILFGHIIREVRSRMNNIPDLDFTDRLLLSLLQDEFPLSADPWGSVAQEAGISTDEVLDRLSDLSSRGILRSIGPVIETRKIGYAASTLIGLKLPPEKIEETAAIINGYPGVSHNYERDHEYNLWFTLACRSMDELQQIKQEILSRGKIPEDRVLDLPIKTRFKIQVKFRIPALLEDTGHGHD
jgi:siroheme decarboxylase